MKRLITGLLVAVVALTTISASHQVYAGPPTKAKPAIGANPLGLSPAQKVKLDGINNKAMKEMLVIRKGGGTQQEQMPKLMALQQKTMTRINTVLTPAQRAKFQQLQSQAMQNAMAAQARDQEQRKNLSPAQMAQLTKLQSAAQANAMKVVSDKNLTQKQKEAKLKAIESKYLAQKNKIIKSAKKR